MARLDVGERVLAEAGELFAAFRWRRCVEVLAAADAQEPLTGAGLLLLGQVAHLVGEDERATAAFARAYQLFLDAGDLRAAARSAVSCAFVLDTAGERIRHLAWGARAERLVEEHDLGGGEAAWLLARRAHLALE